jgi:hypothetical protein
MAIHDYRKGDLQFNADGPHPMPWPGVDKAVDELLVPYFPIVLWLESLIVFQI